MKRKLRVLMVLHNLSVVNGVSSYVMNYFRRLDHDLVDMDFVIYSKRDTPYTKEIEEAGGRIFLIPSIRNISSHIASSEKIIKEGHYDVIHDNILILSYFIMHYAKKYGIPVRIIHSHNSKLGETKFKEIRNKLFMPLLLNTVTHYFACSELAAHGMFGNQPYTFIPNVISPTKFNFDERKRESLRSKYNLRGKVVIGSVGRLAQQKNPFYAIDVMAELYKMNHSIEYWWIGSGHLQDKIEHKIHEMGLDNIVKLLGRRNDMVDLYQVLDAFFMPSFFEGLPVTGIEAQAMGIPCLVSDTVTKQFVFSDLVEFFSIHESPQKVALQMNALLHKDQNRADYNLQLLNSRFCDAKAGDFLYETYLKCLKEKISTMRQKLQ